MSFEFSNNLRFQENLERLQSEKYFPDVELNQGRKSFHGHRIVLASAFLGFHRMFNNNRPSYQIEESQIHPEIFEAILTYAYTAKIKVDADKVKYVAAAATWLNDVNLVQETQKFLRETITSQNMFELGSFAKANGMNELQEHCANMIFDYVRKTPLIGIDEMRKIFVALDANNLSIVQRQELYLAVMDWIRYKPDQRSQYLIEFLDQIPILSFPEAFVVKNIRNEPLINTNLRLLEKLKNVFPAKNRSHEMLFVLGGKTLSNKILLGNIPTSGYSLVYPGWYRFQPLNRTSFGCVSLGNKIYVAGGIKDGQISNSIVEFDIVTGEWTEVQKMNYPRRECSMAVLGDRIYIAGGQTTAQTKLASVECYSTQNGTIQTVGSLNRARAAMEMVELNGFLYAIGGEEKDGKECKIVERYDPESDKWTRLEKGGNLPKAISNFGAAVYDGNIIVISHKHGAIFSPKDNSWREMERTPQFTQKDKIRMVKYDGRLYAVGENNLRPASNDIKVYNSQMKVWGTDETLPMSLDVARSNGRIVILSDHAF